MERVETLKAFILGASGAVGRDLVQELVKSPKWSQVSVVVRRKLEEWDSFSEEDKKKLNIILKDNLDCLEDASQWDLRGYSSVFSCLGARRQQGTENFLKVESTYPLYIGKLACHFGIPHLAFVSGQGASPKSWNFYLKTKGQTEEMLRDLKIPHLTIIRPGIIMERRNDDRIIEKVLGAIPFMPTIKAREIARALRIDAELQHSTPHSKNVVVYSNSNLHYIVKTEKYPENL